MTHFTELPDLLQYYIISFLVPPFSWWSLHSDTTFNHLYMTFKQIKKDFLSFRGGNPFPFIVCPGFGYEATPEDLYHLNPSKLIFLRPISRGVWQTLCKLKHLQHVQIVSPPNIDFSYLQHVISLYIDFQHELKYCAQLRHMKWPTHIKYLTLKKFSNREKLEIPRGVEILSIESSPLSNLLLPTDLKQLDLYQTSLPEISHLSNLESIHLRNCLYEYNWSNLSSLFLLTVNLTHINIKDNSFSNSSYIQDICNGMTSLPKLTFLQLDLWMHLIDFSFLQNLSPLQLLFLPRQVDIKLIKPKTRAQIQFIDSKAPWKPFCLPQL